MKEKKSCYAEDKCRLGPPATPCVCLPPPKRSLCWAGAAGSRGGCDERRDERARKIAPPARRFRMPDCQLVRTAARRETVSSFAMPTVRSKYTAWLFDATQKKFFCLLPLAQIALEIHKVPSRCQPPALALAPIVSGLRPRSLAHCRACLTLLIASFRSLPLLFLSF